MDTADSESLAPQYSTYEKQKCFIAYSEQAAWAEDLLTACQEVLQQPKFNMEADYARKHYVAEVSLRDKALELIANARYGIYDISSWQNEKGIWQEPRNVFIELGMAIALNRPTLLLRHAKNREGTLKLPSALAGLDKHILEFSGYATLKAKLARELVHWMIEDPERAWWNRYCHFGGRVCEYREAHPRGRQWGEKQILCHVADGSDIDQHDFRNVIESVLERFEDIECSYLDELPVAKGYEYLSCTHCQTVRSAPFAVYRITPHTSAETLITIGISIALERQFGYQIPKILLADNMNDIPSLLAGYEVIVARNYQERKAKLRTFVPLVLRKTREKLWKPRPLPFEEAIPSLVADLAGQSEAITEETEESKSLGEPSKNWERFTQRARRVLSLAQEEAGRLNHSFIRSEHVLIGLLQEEGGVAGRVLRELGLDVARVQVMVEQLSDDPGTTPIAELKLSDITKNLLELAVEETRRMGQGYISTEHLLLGLNRQNEGLAIDVLRKFGISPEQIRRQTRRMLKETPLTTTEPSEQGASEPGSRTGVSKKNWERFAQRGRRVLSLAQEEAERLNHSYIESEHVLIGLLREEGGVAGRVLRELGLDPHRIQAMVERLSGGPGTRTPFSKIELAPSTKRILELAVEEARRMGQHYISTEHLLLGLARQGEGLAIDVLRKFGISPEQIRRQTRRMLKEKPNE